ncbi:MAG TPA: FliA/WhiG family RNA polymerase sigma factor [Candidatus Dormibacteraeota bacterium]|nr:FliA/WhiG family RNA polymerase sigma factor [Candidatus Dormibacteraeota bacterium]
MKTSRLTEPQTQMHHPRPSHAGVSNDLRDQLLLDHLPQVLYIARRIHDRLPRQISIEDMVQCGVLGLMDALRKYDANKNVQLRYYAECRIRGAILDGLRQNDWGSRALRRTARKIDQAISNCKFKLGREPSEPELAAALGVSLEVLQRVKGDLHSLQVGSLEAAATNPGREDAVMASTDKHEDPYHQALRSELSAFLAQAVQELPERERKLLELYYFKELTMKNVGAVLGLGESRVSQVHSAILLRLRTRLCNCLSHCASDL